MTVLRSNCANYYLLSELSLAFMSVNVQISTDPAAKKDIQPYLCVIAL